jgi:hypothetical protein
VEVSSLLTLANSPFHQWYEESASNNGTMKGIYQPGETHSCSIFIDGRFYWLEPGDDPSPAGVGYTYGPAFTGPANIAIGIRVMDMSFNELHFYTLNYATTFTGSIASNGESGNPGISGTMDTLNLTFSGPPDAPEYCNFRVGWASLRPVTGPVYLLDGESYIQYITIDGAADGLSEWEEGIQFDPTKTQSIGVGNIKVQSMRVWINGIELEDPSTFNLEDGDSVLAYLVVDGLNPEATGIAEDDGDVAVTKRKVTRIEDDGTIVETVEEVRRIDRGEDGEYVQVVDADGNRTTVDGENSGDADKFIENAINGGAGSVGDSDEGTEEIVAKLEEIRAEHDEIEEDAMGEADSYDPDSMAAAALGQSTGEWGSLAYEFDGGGYEGTSLDPSFWSIETPTGDTIDFSPAGDPQVMNIASWIRKILVLLTTGWLMWWISNQFYDYSKAMGQAQQLSFPKFQVAGNSVGAALGPLVVAGVFGALASSISLISAYFEVADIFSLFSDPLDKATTAAPSYIAQGIALAEVFLPIYHFVVVIANAFTFAWARNSLYLSYSWVIKAMVK